MGASTIVVDGADVMQTDTVMLKVPGLDLWFVERGENADDNVYSAS